MKSAIWALALAMGFAPASWAGDSADSWDNLKQLRVGQKIEVVDMNLKSLKGQFLSFSEEVISLQVGNDQAGVERSGVLRVNSGRSKRGRNALIGLAIGAGAGLGVGAVLDRQATGEFKDFGVILGPPIGAGVGAGVGAAFGGYRTIYRSEKRRAAGATSGGN